MLAEYLRQREGAAVRWHRVMDGVQVCRFALPEVERAEIPVCLPPRHFETFFCQGGRLLLERTQSRLLRAADREILLLSDAGSLCRAEITGALRGVLVTVDAGQARESLAALCRLMDLSLDIPERGITGIVGRSGSGKSTLLKLLMRFWDTQSGRVTVSGTPVSEINTRNLRDMESFVTQETQLFRDSIKANLRIAKQDATDAQLEAACKKAALHEFILTLPQGYDTPVGELGGTLSGGERQRLGLARAFLHDAPFLLLDEPTSNLDSLNEAVILRALREERAGRTVVLVSHRESTMRLADNVYSVEHGRMS